MDLVGSTGSAETFVAAGSLLSTRVPASAFAASDTCPSQKSRMLEPSAGELIYRLFTRRPVGGFFRFVARTRALTQPCLSSAIRGNQSGHRAPHPRRLIERPE
jgi:hypothetical protein